MGFIAQHIGHNKILKPVHDSENQRFLIENLLRHANQKVPFYRGKFSSFLEISSTLNDDGFWLEYTNLPFTTKQNLKDYNADFSAAHFDNLFNLIQDGEPPNPLQALYHLFLKRDFKVSISTGGTSGIPTYRWLDHQDANIMAQSFLESFHQNGWRRGENFVLYYPMRSYFTDSYAKFSDWLHRIFGFSVVPFDQVTLASVQQLLHTLKYRKATLLVIFPCVLQRVAEIMEEHNLGPFYGLKNINVSGEFFLDCSKTFIQKLFPDSRIESTYGAVELGEVAHQHGDSSFDYKVFSDFAYVEQGPHDSLLITSLRQTGFPMIRYQMEDKGTVQTHDNGEQFLVNLEGKNTDFLIGKDDKRYYASFLNEMVNSLNSTKENAIIHFMLRHEENTVQLNFILHKDRSKAQDDIKKAAIETIRDTFPQFETIDVNFVDNFNHDYTRKFKIIGEGDGLAEVVGGYYKHK